MSKKLAIKGYETRGKEVIELLEMIGGNNNFNQYGGNCDEFYYYIENDGDIEYIEVIDNDFIKFTLDEFYKKYPFKVNDKVIDKADGCPGVVCEMKWDEDVSDMKYCVAFGNGIDFGWFANDSIEFCKENKNLEETKSNQDIDKDVFRKEFCECCGSQRCSGQDDELEYCERFKNLMDKSGKPSDKNHKMGPKSKLLSKYYEDKMKEIKTKREYDELRMPLDDDDKLATEATIMDKKILPPDGYLVGKITRTDNGMLVEYVEKKPKYPTTYEECERLMKVNTHISLLFNYLHDECARTEYEIVQEQLMVNFYKLKICRDAYWKIAGEQMGLGKSWKPTSDPVYGITRTCNLICTSNRSGNSQLLEFPTEEMRDAFYENFKKEIEQCKELL